MKVSIIGTGNVATQLALGLEASGVTIHEIYGRDISKARLLTQKLYVADVKSDLNFNKSQADIVIICVSDSAIEDIAATISLPESKVLLHTSGSVPMSLLKKYHNNVGVLYPLQSISKEKKTNWKEVNLVINCSNENYLDRILQIAQGLSKNIYRYSDEQRKAMHLAAVFGSNFTNHLIKIVKDISDAEGLEFEMFHNLIKNTVDKAFEMGPENSQTGPAIRHDTETIEEHLNLIEGTQKLDIIYQLFTSHIQDSYK